MANLLRLVLIAAAAFTLGFLPAVASDDEPTAREEREAAVAEAAAVAQELDLARAANRELEIALAALDEDVRLKQERVAAAGRSLIAAREEVAVHEERIEAIRDLIAGLNDEALASVVDAYVDGTADALDVFGNATSIGEVSTRRTLSDNVNRARTDSVDQLRQLSSELDVELVANERAEVELAERRDNEAAQLRELEAAQRSQQAISDALQERIGEASSAMDVLEGLIDELDERIRIEDEEVERLAAERAAERAAAAERERRAAAEQAAAGNPPVVGSGAIRWPVDNPRVTSEYGPRWGRLHAGIDIAAPTGTPLYAADSGTVVYSAWRGGYGNAVVIDHGNQFSTLYGHMTELGVQEGDTVDSGELIGWMGCTGSCTGPHVHFETRVNGTAQDPRIYLP